MSNLTNWFYSSKGKYHGLVNQGSTCYLNSVLQVLFMTKEFRKAVERHTWENSDSECIDQHLTALFHDLKTRAAHTVDITNKLGISNVYVQRDAADHFEKILTLTSPEASQIFQGQLTHTTICSECRTETGADEPFWNLPLALVDSCGENYSVENGINQFFKGSEMSGENQMYCDECEAKCDATIKCEIKHHPDVLMLLLKRFEFSYRSRSYVKISRVVDVPYTLQIPESRKSNSDSDSDSGDQSQTDQSQTYELYGFVEHSGSLKSGHYTATIKCQDDQEDRWYNFNDCNVTLVNLRMDEMEKSQCAYLLFYRKQKMSDADAGTQDTREVSTSGDPPTTTSDICVQGEDAEEKHDGDDAGEVDNDEAAALSTDRNEETKKVGVSRGEKLSPDCNVEDQANAVNAKQSGLQDNNANLCDDRHNEGDKQMKADEANMGGIADTADEVESSEMLGQESQLKDKNTGLDEVRERTPDHLDEQAKMGDAQRGVVDVKTDKDGKTGDNEQGDVESMEEENKKAEADQLTSMSDKHDSSKHVEDHTRGSYSEQNMPKNEQRCKEGMSNTAYTRQEQQGGRRRDAQGDDEQKGGDSKDAQKSDTSMTKPCLRRGEDPDMRELNDGSDSEKISVSRPAQQYVSVEKQANEQKNAMVTEEAHMAEQSFLRQGGSEREGSLTGNQGAGGDERTDNSETDEEDALQGDCSLNQESRKHCTKRCSRGEEVDNERDAEPDPYKSKGKQSNPVFCCFGKSKKNRKDKD